MPGAEIQRTPSGWFEDPQTGLVAPKPFVQVNPESYLWQRQATFGKGTVAGGIPFVRDEETGIWKMPGYASGWDDFYMRAVVRGDVHNIGIAPVVDPLLSTLVSKLAGMAATWQIMLTGRPTPVGRLADIIATANDSHVGAGDFIAAYIGTMLVDNRGSFISQVPIEKIAFHKWEAYGMMPIPLDKAGDDGEHNLFYLDMTTEDFRATRGLWMVDGLECYPTGNPDWPYWIRKERKEKRDAWILIHRDFGSQMVMPIGSYDRKFRAYGQSGTWRYLHMLAQEIIRVEMDVESMLNTPPNGIIWGTGLDSADQLANVVEGAQEKRREKGVMYASLPIFGGSIHDKADIIQVRFNQPPAGYEFDSWRQMKEDYLTACFQVSVSQVVTRFGEGAMTQSGVADQIQSETGLASIKKMLEAVYGSIAPPRVMVTMNWLSDRQRRYQIESFEKFARGVRNIQETGYEEPIFTRAEIRALVEQKTGLDIPVVQEDDTTQEQGTNQVVDAPEGSESDTTETMAEPPTLDEIDLPEWVKFAVGNQVRIIHHDVEGIIAGRDNGFIRVRHEWHQLPGAAASYRPQELHLVKLHADDN